MKLIIPFLLIISLSSSLSAPAQKQVLPFIPKTFDVNTIVNYVLQNPKILENVNKDLAIQFLSTVPDLQKFVIQKPDGTRDVDWISLLNDQAAKTLIQKMINEKIGKMRLPRAAFDFNTILNLFKPMIDRINQQINNQAQQLITQTIGTLFQQVQDAIFKQVPLDFNKIAQNFLDNLKTSLKNSISTSISEEFKIQAQQILDSQFNGLYALLNQLNTQQIAPAQFITALKTGVDNLKNLLQNYIPQVSDIIKNQINNNFLGQLLKAA